MNHKTHEQAGKMSQQLRVALENYRVSHDIESLALEYHRHRTKEMGGGNKKNSSSLYQFLRGMRYGFSTFSLWPTGRRGHYLGTSNASDVESLYSDWSSVGNDLAYSWSKYLVDQHDRRRA